MLLGGKKVFFSHLRQPWFVITKSHLDGRTDSRADRLAGQAPRIKGPTAEFGFDVSQASRKET